MKIKLDDGAKVSRAHEDDAGLDLYAREDKVVPAHGSAAFDTGGTYPARTAASVCMERPADL